MPGCWKLATLPYFSETDVYEYKVVVPFMNGRGAFKTSPERLGKIYTFKDAFREYGKSRPWAREAMYNLVLRHTIPIEEYKSWRSANIHPWPQRTEWENMYLSDISMTRIDISSDSSTLDGEVNWTDDRLLWHPIVSSSGSAIVGGTQIPITVCFRTYIEIEISFN